MSQAILYHTQGVAVYRYSKFFSKKGEDFYRIYLPPLARRCANCGGANVGVKETVKRRIRGAPTGGREIIIVASIPKFFCHDYQAIRQAKLPFAKPMKRYTKRFAEHALALLQGVTVKFVADLETGRVLFVNEGKDAESLLPFWRRVRRNRIQIVAVATDMSPAYTSAVKKNLPDAVHVYDRFHVVKMIQETIDATRFGS